MRRFVKGLSITAVIVVVIELASFVGLSAYAEYFIPIFPPSEKRIIINPGGGVLDFIEDFSNDRNANTKYIVDGMCISACTLLLGEIPEENVCITPWAMMAFHAAYSTTNTGIRIFSPEGTEMVWRVYPEWVRKWLRENGWKDPHVDQPTLIFMPNEVLRDHYRPCNTKGK